MAIRWAKNEISDDLSLVFRFGYHSVCAFCLIRNTIMLVLFTIFFCLNPNYFEILVN